METTLPDRQITIGVLAPFFGGNYLAQLMSGILRVAQANNARVIAIRTGNIGTFELPIASSQVDAWILLLRAVTDKYVGQLLGDGKPIVAIGHGFSDPRLLVVDSDDDGSLAEVIKALTKAGHQHIAYVCPLNDYRWDRRRQAYRKTLVECGLPYRPEYLVDSDNFGHGGGARATAKILKQRLPITALCAGTDRIAIGAMMYLQDVGVSIPEKIAIIGYDNVPLAQDCVPPLASVDVNLDQQAEKAVISVLEQIKSGQLRSGRLLVPCTFIPRQSCGLQITQSVIVKDQMTAVENSLEVLQNVGKNLKNVQALIPLLLNYFQKVSVSRWEAPIAEPEMLTTRRIYDRNNPAGNTTHMRHDIRTFPIISSGSDSPSAYEDFICVLPITTHEKPWGVIEASGLVGKGWPRLQAKMMQYIELIAPAFERAALDEELVSYQMGLEELVRQRTAELREKTEQLREAKEWAESASAAKTTFLANMSHELRSPLNAILGFSRLLTRKPGLSNAVKDDLRVILSSGEHLYELINQVLNLAKIEAGLTTLNESNFDLYEILDELKDMFHLVTKHKQLQLLMEIDATIPRHIKADAVKLRQVLINLVNNALKFTSKGSVTIRITKEKEFDEKTASCRLLFAVIDTGPGIAPEELNMLSVAFVQANAGRHAQEGTGLGLAISRGFVEAMGGTLRLTSQLGQGTTVEFAIPIRIVAAEIADDSQRKAKATIVGLAPGQPSYRILAVDDRATSRQILDRLLTPCGFEVRQASNGQEALEIWEAWGPHLIFMDMRMPITSGQEATQRIKTSAKGKTTVIIALTASSFEEDREQLLSIGCDDFLRKPFQENALFELIHKHLGAKLVYEATDQPSTSAAVDKQRLMALPKALRGQLADAINCFDDERIESVIAEIRVHDAVIGDALNSLIARFSYDLVLNLLSNK